MSEKSRDFRVQWKKFFWIVGIFLALMLLLYFRFTSSRQAEGIAEIPLPVKVIPIRAERIKLYDTVIGRIKGGQNVKVLSGAAGFVVDIKKSRGDGVEKGEVIMVLEDSGRLYELKEAQGRRSLARAEFDETHRKHSQYKRLFDKGVVSRDELDSALSAMNRAQAQLEALEAAYKKTKWYYDRLKIRSPLSGTITEIPPDTGQEVLKGETVARVAGNRKNSVVAGVDSSIAKRTKRGAKVVVEYKTPDGVRSAVGTVVGVSKETDAFSTTYSLEVSVDDDDVWRELWSGEFVNLKVEAGSLADVVRIPITAVFYKDRKPLIFVAREGRAVKISLKSKPVRVDSGTVAIPVSLFSGGSQVIIEGGSRLEEGRAVQILKDR
ncbi:efflux RND transporter periplasmic adaptor subunit [Candidatus Mycalebacterium sp.]